MFAWIFPGQGSQSVGMAGGLDSPVAADVFDTAEKILGWDVRLTCQNASEEQLRATDVAQPAILTVSVAAARTLEAQGFLPDFVAGHSVGEFAALVAAQAISFEDALRAVGARADAMAREGRAHPGGMAAVIGLGAEQVEAICVHTPGVVVANINGPDQVVISGECDALDAASHEASEKGARRVIPLQVSVAAHSPLMDQATKDLKRALEGVTSLRPLVPFASGLTGRLHTDPDELPKLLLDALTQPVRWTDCVRTLKAAGARRFVEVGPGRVLSGLVRRIDPAIELHQVCSDAAAEALGSQLVRGA